ncbi:class iii [Apiospora arundinis]
MSKQQKENHLQRDLGDLAGKLPLVYSGFDQHIQAQRPANPARGDAEEKGIADEFKGLAGKLIDPEARWSSPEESPKAATETLFRWVEDQLVPAGTARGSDENWTRYQIRDMCGGAAVACLGTGNNSLTGPILEMMDKQNKQIAYMAHAFGTAFAPKLLMELLCMTANLPLSPDSPDRMSHAMILNSGSEANETAIKLVAQYWNERNKNAEAGTQQKKDIIISRHSSYHGNTLGALSMSEFPARQDTYKRFLLDKNFVKVSRYYPYRDQGERTDEKYLTDLVDELEKAIQSLGKDRVAAFVFEPVSGAALGCQPAPDAYLQKVKEVCRRNDVLLVYDEVMCGMGRTGYTHAWHYYNEKFIQSKDYPRVKADESLDYDSVAPDIQIIGKGLGAGLVAAAGVIVGKKVVDTVRSKMGGGEFIHGHTYQSHIGICAGALMVQLTIPPLLPGVRKLSKNIEEVLKELAKHHPNVGNVRGRGFFWGVEFVKNKTSKEPFKEDVAFDLASYGERTFGHEAGPTKVNGVKMCPTLVYPGAWKTTNADGEALAWGHHVIISPAYHLKENEINTMMLTFLELVNDYFFAKYKASKVDWSNYGQQTRAGKAVS